ncbi:MAG: hypothetical protein AVDCRST_MAG01-01-3719 [uncultured Rubrobacteraceae bacterium]|uniref:Uncharacterized protein n=1 Tax=uncultured Rubrobacteraceae bacterium TaxID=349277 RepID=A0A6J4QMQ1_9ACTN|nr:MAG: hypothetical protein AVDCRST_MAG01-01-3719 [uncultured Rubrobacteraceae bacterium]
MTRYEEAVEALIRDPSPERDLAASRAHYYRACYVWLTPRWVGWYRERRLKRAMRMAALSRSKVPSACHLPNHQ